MQFQLIQEQPFSDPLQELIGLESKTVLYCEYCASVIKCFYDETDYPECTHI